MRFVIYIDGPATTPRFNRRMVSSSAEQHAEMIEYFQCTEGEAGALIRVLDALRSRA